ncbi:retrotransposon protein, putative, ty1-copia subclass [Tanacetum coccineum]
MMIMISKMRDNINPRKKRLNLEEEKGQKVEKSFGPDFVSFMVGNEPTSYREANKMKADGTIVKHKARLVIKEFRQREGLDYFDTYSPVTRITSTRMVLAIAALRNLEVHLMDVNQYGFVLSQKHCKDNILERFTVGGSGQARIQ